jgi:hypothetical protein
MANTTGTDRASVHHYRRATDRAAERVSRAADRGDTTALRIASSQYESLARQRAEHGDTAADATEADRSEAR